MPLVPQLIIEIFQLECPRALHETLFVPVLMYGSETMLWKKKEIQSQGCTDGTPQKIAWYQKDRWGPKCTDKRSYAE